MRVARAPEGARRLVDPGSRPVVPTAVPQRERTTHVFLDFFGTLVSYSESRVAQGYPRSHEILSAAGARIDYSAFLERWNTQCEEFESAAVRTLDEFSMDEVCAAFLRATLPEPPSHETIAHFRDTYLDEWNQGVEPIAGVSALLAELAQSHTLVLVSNTNHADLVLGHLRAIDALRHLAGVITSVEHGKRKPSPRIFEHAMERTGAAPGTSIYVGDSHAADYLGAAGAGLRCLLIDPDRRWDVPESDRLRHILDLRAHLAP
jgi:putative hydrolase of the HAD superfamily